jgi:hypothetical protein
VDLYDWLLFFHVLTAAMTVASVVAFTVVFLVDRAGDEAPVRPLAGLAQIAVQLWTVGGFGVLLLGIWLAIERDQYQPWDGWIIAAYVLWLVAGFGGTQLGFAYRARFGAEAPAGSGRRPPRAVASPAVLLLVMAVGVALLLIDMIYKPGA